MLELKVTNQYIKIIQAELLVGGSSGEYECRFMFDDSWEGFTKTAVFVNRIASDTDCGETEKSNARILIDDKCIIPADVLRNNSKLKIGVFGVKDEVRRPTIYTSELLVRIGASDVSSIPDPEESVYVQIIELLQESNENVQGLKDSLSGGLSGQVLSKRSEKDLDFEWVEQTGGSGGVSSWGELEGKPFDELSLDEMEVTGLESNRQLGIKEIAQSKVTGLEQRLTQIGGAIDEKQPKGNYALKSDIPEKLPNPNALTFTGAVSASYDGTEPVSVEIPEGGGSGFYELTINGTSASHSAASVMEAYAAGKTIRATINGTAEIVTRVQRVSDTDCVVLLHVGSNAAESGQNSLSLYERGFQLSGSTVLGNGVTQIPILNLQEAPPEATQPVYSNGFGGLVTLPSTEGPPGPAGPAGIEGFYSSKSAYPASTCVKYCTQATSWNQNELNEKQGPEWQTPGSVILLAINCDNGNTYISIQEVVSSTRLQPKTYWISRKGDKGDPGQDGSGGGGSPGGSGVVKICDITLGGPAKKMVYDVGADTEYFMIKMSAEIPKVGNGLGDFKFWVNDLPVQQDWKFTDTRTNIINVCALPSETSVFGSFFFQLALWQNKNFGSAAREGNVLKTRIYGIETWGNGVLPTGSRLRLWGIK